MIRLSSIYQCSNATTAILLASLVFFAAPETKGNDMTIRRSTIKDEQGTLSAINIPGDGLPVVFVHADPGTAEQWAQIMAEIADLHAAAAYDARGAGTSSPSENGDYSYEARALDLGAVADHFGYRRFAIVAHSGGSAVAMAYASKHPDRVAGLFLLDPPNDPRALPSAAWDQTLSALRGPEGQNVFLNYVVSLAGPDVSVQQRVRADALGIVAEARVGMTEALSRWNPADSYALIRNPLFMLSTANNTQLVKLWRLSDEDHAQSSTSGHWIQLDDPALVVRKLRGFLDRIDTRQ